MNSKLYFVRTRGAGNFYVVAENSHIAYEKVKKDLDEKNLEFSSDRELNSINLEAEDCDYPNCKVRLFL